MVSLCLGRVFFSLLLFSWASANLLPLAVQGNNRFGFSLLSELMREEAKRNIFISPTSIFLALTMTYNGANGETKEAMAKTLNFEGIDLDSLNATMGYLHHRLKSPIPQIDLKIANSLWARKGISFKKDFLGRNKKFFQAEVKTLDFSQPSAVKVLNRWVEKNTKGKIKKIIERIDANAVLFLLNALYFQGKWQKEFDKRETKEDTFHSPEGREKVLMMSQSGRFPYLKEETFSAVSLPYGEGEISIYLFLPETSFSLFALVERLGERWEEVLERFKEREGDISLPRWEMTYEKSLREILKGMNMAIAFDPQRADFTRMREEGELFINDVWHKTYLKITEEGAEAAAVTSVEISLTALPERFHLIFNRPFFFAIRDNRTGLLLFTGVFFKPKG